MKKALWLLKRSLLLDWQLFIRCDLLETGEKFEFLIKKHYLLARHFFKKYSPGQDYVFLNKEKIYYDSPYGLAGYQGMLTTQLNLIKTAGIEKASVIIDVGANVGLFSKLCRRVFKDAHIYATEPIVEVFQCLVKNFTKDQGAKIYNLALGKEAGRLKMRYDNQNSAISSINPEGEIEVTVDTLDNLIFKNGIQKIDILKIDTEGFEKQVLEGGKRALAMTKYLFLEITLEGNDKYSMSSLMGMLCAENYEYQLVAFRNFAGRSSGAMPVMEAWLQNIKLD